MKRTTRRAKRSHPFLVSARLSRGLSQQEVADRLGVSQAAYGYIENGERSLSWKRALDLASTLAVPLQYLLTGTCSASEDPASLAFELHHYGAYDLSLDRAPVVGAFRRVEEVIALAVGGLQPSPRIIEAVPAVLLANPWSGKLLAAHAESAGTSQRVGWLVELANSLATQASIAGRARWSPGEIAIALRSIPKPEHFDSMGVPVRDRSVLPPVSKRWKVDYDVDFLALRRRTTELLDHAQSSARFDPAPPARNRRLARATRRAR